MKRKISLASLAALAWGSIAAPAAASELAAVTVQSAGAAAQDEAASTTSADASDIIVTARRRNETTLDTPVVLSAFSGEQLTRLAVTNMTDVAKLTPMLIIAPASGAQGGNLTLRGVASPTSNAAAEPAVTVNIDGVPLSYGGVVRMGNIDIGQIEILKGPQALFFGKNSTGGIVSIRSAEPTTTYKSQLSVGYEFNARQVDVDGFVSGPVGETLELRLAGRFSRQRGYFRNVAPGATFRYGPGTDEDGIRLSANWHPDDRLMVKLRGTYDNVRENGSFVTGQKIACPLGSSQGPGAIPGTDDCTANDTIVYAAIPGAAIRALTGNPDFASDASFVKVKQHLISSDISYQLTDSITLNSVTGFYGIRQHQLDAAPSGARLFISSASRIRKDVFSQELRLSFKSPDSPIDLMLGGFYQNDRLLMREQGIVTVPVLSLRSPLWVFPLRSKAVSAFGQVGWDITPQFNLSAGVRYSRDRKSQNIVPAAPLVNKFTTRSIEFSNWSPEATLSFKPNPDTNLFVSFREGYKSGAYQIGYNVYNGPIADPRITDIPGFYKPETVKGFEAGLKTRLFDRQLRLNLAAYTYRYKDLQLSRLDPVLLAIFIVNASSARVKGLEGDFTFTPHGAPGLTITGSAVYNSAKYDSPFLGQCYPGQTVANGCTIDGPDAGTVPDLQEYLGRPLPRAPKFSASAGATYQSDVGSSHKVTFNLNGIYTSKYFLGPELHPLGFTPNRFLLDGSIAFGSQSGSYEVSLVGRNLTNRHFAYSGFVGANTGSGTGTPAGIASDYEGTISRGREIWVRLTLRPSSF